MRSVRKPSGTFLPAPVVTALLSLSVLFMAQTIPAGPQVAVLPAPGEIEQDLLRVLNAERLAQGLPVLRLSPELVGLARTQSSEMARLKVLSHESAAGLAFPERLAGAGIAFAATGENVARSGTYLAKLIHESFMGSPGHRENVLNPLFDEVGIGIAAGAENSYYVTEDFIRALVERPNAEVRAFILGVLDEARVAAGRPPVVLLDQAVRMAQEIAQEKAAGRPVPPAPAFFGETLVRVATGPDLDMVAGRIRGQELADYGRAGIGVSFGRSPEFPGGAYSVCALLIRDRPGPGPDDLERLLAVLKAVNGIRIGKKLPPLELDAGLSERADAVIARKRSGGPEEGAERAEGSVFFSMFQKLGQIGPELRKRLGDPAVRRAGISTLPVRTEDGVPLLYAIAVVLGR
jgi:uncharacterized protein YkwD